MRAVVFHKPNDVRVDRIEDPIVVDARDVVLRVTSTAICGSDLHIYSGAQTQRHPLVMGHEFMGIVEDVGDAVKNVARGDRVIACAHEDEAASGGQAELVRVPRADESVRKVPDALRDEQVLFLSDILPTGWSAIEWAGMKGGETVAVFGCGPAGIMAQKCAWLQGAKRVFAIDKHRYRLAKAREAAGCKLDAIAVLRDLTDGRGPDVCIDAVGMEAERRFFSRRTAPVLFDCLDAVRRGGHVSIVGAYGEMLSRFPIGLLFEKGVRLAAGHAHPNVDALLDLIAKGKLRVDDVITHELPLEQAPKAYDIFAKRKDNCVKVVLKPGGVS